MVGSGGARGWASFAGQAGDHGGGNGGTTSVSIDGSVKSRANGGNGSPDYSIHGTGNGNGGRSGNDGTNGSGYIFNNSGLGLAGGGGGAGTAGHSSYQHVGGYRTYGGDPHGAYGAYVVRNSSGNVISYIGAGGAGIGGGGGGGGGVISEQLTSCSGGTGAVYIRFYRN